MRILDNNDPKRCKSLTFLQFYDDVPASESLLLMATFKTTLFTTAFILLTSLYLSAGDLMPPVGTPSSTMKTLDEIEPRIPIDPEGQVDIIIDTPGHYFFTKAASIDELDVQAGGVTIDFGGFAHSMQNFIGVSSESPSLPVILRNGTLLSGTVIWAMDADNDLRLEKLHFEGGTVNFEGIKLLIQDCTFAHSADSAQDFALQLGSASLYVDGLAIVGYPTALNMPQILEDSTYVLKNLAVSDGSSGIVISGAGDVSLIDFQMNGDSSAGSTAIELVNDVSLFLREGALKGYATLIKCSASVSLRADDTQFLISDEALSLISFQSSLSFERCVFSPVASSGQSGILLNGSFNGGSAVLRGCTIERLQQLVASGTPAYDLLSFKDCSIKDLNIFAIPERSVFDGGLIETAQSYQVSLFEKSRFRNVDFCGSGGDLYLEDGVSIVSSNISGFDAGVRLDSGNASLRDTQVIAGSAGQDGLEGSPSSTFHLSGSVVDGFITGLRDGTFILDRSEILDCATAIDVDQITVRDSIVSANVLGSVNGRAILLGSVFRAGTDGLVVNQVQARDTVFDCSDDGSGTAIQIQQPGGSVVGCSFSGFGTGINASFSAVISDNSFFSLVWAVDGQNAQELNITDNVIADCVNGMDAGGGALVRNNQVSVSSMGIQGEGLIVQNTVVTASGTAYNLGNGTIGRELTGNAINPTHSPTVEDAGEPWANVWEGP